MKQPVDYAEPLAQTKLHRGDVLFPRVDLLICTDRERVSIPSPMPSTHCEEVLITSPMPSTKPSTDCEEVLIPSPMPSMDSEEVLMHKAKHRP